MIFEEKCFRSLRYLIRYPNGFVPEKKYPLIVLLHGSGTRGSEIERLKENHYFMITEGYADFEFVTLAPLCEKNSWVDCHETLTELVLQTVALPFCDSSRVYAVGQSMGGYATWQIARSLPEIFAAIVPISGGGMCWNAERLSDVPVWAFHGELDDVVSPSESENMVKAVNAAGGQAKLTVIPDTRHSVWLKVYRNREVFRWLLSHSRKEG